MKNTIQTTETVTVEEMRKDLLAMLQTCFNGSAQMQGDCIRLRLDSGEEFLVSAMGVL